MGQTGRVIGHDILNHQELEALQGLALRLGNPLNRIAPQHVEPLDATLLNSLPDLRRFTQPDTQALQHRPGAKRVGCLVRSDHKSALEGHIPPRRSLSALMATAEPGNPVAHQPSEEVVFLIRQVSRRDPGHSAIPVGLPDLLKSVLDRPERPPPIGQGPALRHAPMVGNSSRSSLCT